MTITTDEAGRMIVLSPVTLRGLLRECGIKTGRGRELLWTPSRVLAVLAYAAALRHTSAGAAASGEQRRELLRHLWAMSPEVLEAAIAEGRRYVLCCRGKVHAALVPEVVVRRVDGEMADALRSLGLRLEVLDLRPLYQQVLAGFAAIRSMGQEHRASTPGSSGGSDSDEEYDTDEA